MDKHPRCGTVLQLANKQQTADCRRNVDRPQSPVGALRSCGFVQVSNQHDSAPGSLCNVSQTAEYRAHLVCSVHVHICAQKRLYRVNDNQPCVVFPDCPCYALIGKGQRCVPKIESSGVPTTEDIRQRRLELDKLLQTPPVDEEIARQKAMELAVLTLVSVEMEEYEAHRLRSIFGKQAKMRELDANLLRQNVRKITFGSKTVKVLLKNNQVLEECDDA